MENRLHGYDDKAILGISDLMDQGSEKNLFHVVKGCVVGAQCSKTHLVSIAVHEGFEENPRHFDLHVERYVKSNPKLVTGVIFVNQDGVHMHTWPFNNKRKLLRAYSFFGVVRHYSPDAHPPRNELYDRLQGSKAARRLWGNVVAVRTDQNGYVINMEESDLALVEEILFGFVAHDEGWPDYPMYEDPLHPIRRDSSWY